MKTLDVWITHKEKGVTVKFTLPITNFRNVLISTFKDIEGVNESVSSDTLFKQFKIERISDLTIRNVYKDDIFDVVLLNQLLIHVNTTYKGSEDIYFAFIAIQEATDYNVKNALQVLLKENFEFFPDILEMSELAYLLVKLSRIFKVKVPSELRPFLDYNKIGENMSANGEFVKTSLGIIWFKDNDEKEQ